MAKAVAQALCRYLVALVGLICVHPGEVAAHAELPIESAPSVSPLTQPLRTGGAPQAPESAPQSDERETDDQDDDAGDDEAPLTHSHAHAALAELLSQRVYTNGSSADAPRMSHLRRDPRPPRCA